MTAQAHEQLILDGRPTSMMSCPLLPLHDPRLRTIDVGADPHPLSDDVKLTRSTACWRKYIGYWQIKDDRLYLIRVVGAYLFDTKEPVLADWVWDTLRVPYGKLLKYVHMGFDSVYEREIEIVVEAGVVISREVIEHDQDASTQPALTLLMDVVAQHLDQEIRSLAMTKIVRDVAQGGIDDERIIPFLHTCLTDANPRVRNLAVEGIGDRGAAAAGALPTLLAMRQQDPWDNLVARAIWRVQFHAGSVPDLIARVDELDALSWSWKEIYELLEALLDIGPAAAEAAPALLKLKARIRRYVRRWPDKNDWLNAPDSIDETVAIVGATLRVDEIAPFTLSPASWPDKQLVVQPGELRPPSAPPHAHEATLPDLHADEPGQRQTWFYRDVEDQDLLSEASDLGMAVDERHFALFLSYADHPGEDGYLAQLRIVGRTALRDRFGALTDAEWERFPEQPATIGQLLTGFVHHQRAEWTEGQLEGILECEDSDDVDELGFGLRVEDAEMRVYRIWSRVWLHWQPDPRSLPK